MKIDFSLLCIAAKIVYRETYYFKRSFVRKRFEHFGECWSKLWTLKLCSWNNEHSQDKLWDDDRYIQSSLTSNVSILTVSGQSYYSPISFHYRFFSFPKFNEDREAWTFSLFVLLSCPTIDKACCLAITPKNLFLLMSARDERADVTEHEVMRKLKWYVEEDEKKSNKAWRNFVAND